MGKKQIHLFSSKNSATFASCLKRLFNLIICDMAYKISEDLCVACGTCIGECPTGAISEGDVYSIDPNICIDCGTCAGVCPSGAIAPEE